MFHHGFKKNCKKKTNYIPIKILIVKLMLNIEKRITNSNLNIWLLAIIKCLKKLNDDVRINEKKK